MSGKMPHRSSCRTAPRMRACVDNMSVPYAPLSTSMTRAPARASNMAVAAPAQRAPTTIASTFMVLPVRVVRTGSCSSELRCPAPMNTAMHHHDPSVRGDADVDRNTVGEHVEDGRSGHTLLDDAAQLFGGRIARDVKADSDPLVAVSDLVRQSENAQQIDVAFYPRLDGGERHPANRGDVTDASCDAGGQRVQQEFDRRRSAIEANQDRGMVGTVAELRDVSVFAPCPAE